MNGTLEIIFKCHSREIFGFVLFCSFLPLPSVHILTVIIFLLGSIQKVLETCTYNQCYMKSLGCATIKICEEIMSFVVEEIWGEVGAVEMTGSSYTVLMFEGHKAQKIF